MMADLNTVPLSDPQSQDSGENDKLNQVNSDPYNFDGVSSGRIFQIGAVAVRLIRQKIEAGELKELAVSFSKEELEIAEKYLDLWGILTSVADTEQEFVELLAWFIKIKP